MNKELECKCRAMELTLLLALAVETTKLTKERRNELCDTVSQLVDELQTEAQGNG